MKIEQCNPYLDGLTSSGSPLLSSSRDQSPLPPKTLSSSESSGARRHFGRCGRKKAAPANKPNMKETLRALGRDLSATAAGNPSDRNVSWLRDLLSLHGSPIGYGFALHASRASTPDWVAGRLSQTWEV